MRYSAPSLLADVVLSIRQRLSRAALCAASPANVVLSIRQRLSRAALCLQGACCSSSCPLSSLSPSSSYLRGRRLRRFRSPRALRPSLVPGRVAAVDTFQKGGGQCLA